MLKVLDNEVAQEEQAEGPTLDELAREGARRMLMKALAVEVAQYVEAHGEERDAQGRRWSCATAGRRRGRSPAGPGRWRSRHPHQRQACGGGRPAPAVHESYPAALHALLTEGRRGAAHPLSAGAVDRRLSRSVAGVARRGRGRPECHQHRAPHGGVGRGVSPVPAAGSRRPRLRVCLGRRDSLQHPSRGRSPLHAGDDWGPS